MRLNDVQRAAIIWLASVVGCSGPTSTIQSVPSFDQASGGEAVTFQAGETNNNSSNGDVPTEQRPLRPAINRQIIYNADILVEVDDIDRMAEQLDVQLRELQGFVANYNEQRYEGDRRTATWTVRMDATRFPDLLKWLDDETNVIRKLVTSKDVTEEYVDLNSRLTNKKATEKRLTVLLEERSGKLEEVLAFEKEIDRTREEIEKIEGRLRLLRDQIALSTITLTASTRIDYLGAKTTSLATSVSETWMQSVGKLQVVCRWLLLGIVGLIPWVPVFAMLAGLLWLAKAASRKFTKQRG